VADRKPPRLASGESDTLRALLQFQRESLLRKVADLDDASARRSFVGSGTTLLWLIKHVARAEVTWVLYRFAGQDVVIPPTSLIRQTRWRWLPTPTGPPGSRSTPSRSQRPALTSSVGGLTLIRR
jgi:Protein of unknown function (DUF664)